MNTMPRTWILLIALLLSARHAVARGEDSSATIAVLKPVSVSSPHIVATAAAIERGFRLALFRSGGFHVLTEEETSAALEFQNRPPPGECFSRPCLEAISSAVQIRGEGRTGEKEKPDYLLASRLLSSGDGFSLELILFATAPARPVAALREEWQPAKRDPISASRNAIDTLLHRLKESAPPDLIDKEWKPEKEKQGEERAMRLRHAAVGAGLALAALAVSFHQGQLLQEDGNADAPDRPVLSSSGTGFSRLRGFFASATPGPEYAAQGGAGLAKVNDGAALLLNPGGLALAEEESVLLLKNTLPGGTPSLFLAYSGPLAASFHQGLGIRYEGDKLAGETTFFGALATDLARFSRYLSRLDAGIALKVYLARVGAGGSGEDRATGHSAGFGLDLGLIWPMSEKIEAGFAVQDVLGMLWHNNTFTGRRYSEVMPPAYTIGSLYKASPTLKLLLDGQKSIHGDQVDHVRLGGEKVLFGSLALRCGLHQAFGREPIRILSAGFGLETEVKGMSLGLNYSYDFGLDDARPLGGHQSFGMEMGF